MPATGLNQMGADAMAGGDVGGAPSAGGGGVSIRVFLHPVKKQTPKDCKDQAEGGGGASAYDEFGKACWKVYGKAVKIQPDIHSIMEGFIITNMNFNTSGSGGASPNQAGAPGAKSESTNGFGQGSTINSPSSIPYNTAT
jgi:hypothetical protein